MRESRRTRGGSAGEPPSAGGEVWVAHREREVGFRADSSVSAQLLGHAAQGVRHGRGDYPRPHHRVHEEVALALAPQRVDVHEPLQVVPGGAGGAAQARDEGGEVQPFLAGHGGEDGLRHAVAAAAQQQLLERVAAGVLQQRPRRHLGQPGLEGRLAGANPRPQDAEVAGGAAGQGLEGSAVAASAPGHAARISLASRGGTATTGRAGHSRRARVGNDVASTAPPPRRARASRNGWWTSRKPLEVGEGADLGGVVEEQDHAAGGGVAQRREQVEESPAPLPHRARGRSRATTRRRVAAASDSARGPAGSPARTAATKRSGELAAANRSKAMGSAPCARRRPSSAWSSQVLPAPGGPARRKGGPSLRCGESGHEVRARDLERGHRGGRGILTPRSRATSRARG